MAEKKRRFSPYSEIYDRDFTIFAFGLRQQGMNIWKTVV